MWNLQNITRYLLKCFVVLRVNTFKYNFHVILIQLYLLFKNYNSEVNENHKLQFIFKINANRGKI